MDKYEFLIKNIFLFPVKASAVKCENEQAVNAEREQYVENGQKCEEQNAPRLIDLLVQVHYDNDNLLMVSTERNGTIFCGVLLSMQVSSNETPFGMNASKFEQWKQMSAQQHRDDICELKEISSVISRQTSEAADTKPSYSETVNDFRRKLKWRTTDHWSMARKNKWGMRRRTRGVKRLLLCIKCQQQEANTFNVVKAAGKRKSTIIESDDDDDGGARNLTTISRLSGSLKFTASTSVANKKRPRSRINSGIQINDDDDDDGQLAQSANNVKLETKQPLFNGTEPSISGNKEKMVVAPLTLKISYGKRSQKKTTVIKPKSAAVVVSTGRLTAASRRNGSKSQGIIEMETDHQAVLSSVQPSSSVIDDHCSVCSSSSSSSDGSQHQVGDLVWAKLKGYSPWPAEICSLNERRIRVRWCGTADQTNSVPLSSVENFQQKFTNYYNPSQRQEYQQAVADALVKDLLAGLNGLCYSKLLSPDCRTEMLQLLQQDRPQTATASVN
ncbi:PWWP domain-containing protein 2A [Trichinella spiralis]|uniref:PWWP domain-containing protein 2A n=1 Tax=Trichinella spiralis TaxID=6334 RepID=A0ABR3KZN0_TRISP